MLTNADTCLVAPIPTEIRHLAQLRPMTRLAWQNAHDGSPARLGYDRSQHLVGQVAFYDVVAGGASGWVGYVRGERVTGRCESAELAQQLVGERST